MSSGSEELHQQGEDVNSDGRDVQDGDAHEFNIVLEEVVVNDV